MRMKMKKGLSKEEQKAYLLSKKGRIVTFRYPEPPYVLQGKLFDRFAIKDGVGGGVVYWNVIDLIKFEGEEREDWLRLTYYRYKKKENRWVFAGQTSLTNPISGILELFIKAIKEKDWIRTLFTQVCRQCSKELNVEKL